MGALVALKKKKRIYSTLKSLQKIFHRSSNVNNKVVNKDSTMHNLNSETVKITEETVYLRKENRTKCCIIQTQPENNN